jgi:polar amino acid transport system substrate-binding protein
MRFHAAILTLLCVVLSAPAQAMQAPVDLRVGVAGSEPFVVRSGESGFEGIAVEIWETVAANAGWKYRLEPFKNVPEAMTALKDGKVDVVIGPVSITSARAQFSRFSQPYFASSLSIVSRTDPPGLRERLAPFFNRSFYIALAIFFGLLVLVGALIWLAETRIEHEAFPRNMKGLGNGIWFAVVTMSTVGYGDLAPRSILGRVITGVWIVFSIASATTLVAGISSTLTLTGMQANTIGTAEELRGRSVAVVANSPGAAFAKGYGAKLVEVASLDEAFTSLEQKNADAIVFDRPQLRYQLRKRGATDVAVSSTQYAHQNYGFALPEASTLVHDLNIRLLELEESGRVTRIVQAWLGDDDELGAP